MPSEKPHIMTRISDEFICRPDCPVCLGEGHVCEDHYWKPWSEGDGCCGAAGMPCPGIGYQKLTSGV